MAIYKIFPEKDSTVYSKFPLRNTGIDEIIEATTFYDGVQPEVSRFLIKFAQNEIEDVLDNKIEDSSFQTNLRCYIANATGLTTERPLEIYPVSGAWDMGTGKYLDSPQTTNGVSWTFRSYSGSNAWVTESFSAYVTASFSGSNGGGGNWYTGSALGLDVTQAVTLSYSSDKDINVNVTNTILTWYSQSKGETSDGFTNDGFLVKQSDENEFLATTLRTSELKYFSIDTHTIYPPQLEFKWRDFTFATGSSTNTIIDTSKAVISLDNNQTHYYSGSIAKFRLNCRPQFPTRTFLTGSDYTRNRYLPTASYYALKDLDTNEFVIDFDTQYTQISADSENSYFIIYMNGLEPERYYSILVKTTIDGETIIFDDNLYFKVING
jgi:hypothetical protein